MQQLKNAYRGERAAVICGGPSLIEQRVNLRRLKSDGYVVFVEAKALTPYLLEQGGEPDYFVMPFPEKCKDNALQHFIFRSFLARIDIRSCLKPAYRLLVDDMRKNFTQYFEPWRPERGSHKRYRWKPDVFLKDSPFDLLGRLPSVKVITNEQRLAQQFPGMRYQNPRYLFEQAPGAQAMNLEKYYHPLEQDGRVILRANGFLNSAAIALFPLLRFMGFSEVYLLGMDMSMLGSLEYAALYTFRSMAHFWWFFMRAKGVFNAAYKVNRPFYFRPRSEFEDARAVLNCDGIQFIRVYEPFKYAAPLQGVRTISLAEFERRREVMAV